MRTFNIIVYFNSHTIELMEFITLRNMCIINQGYDLFLATLTFFTSVWCFSSTYLYCFKISGSKNMINERLLPLLHEITNRKIQNILI